MMSRLTGGNDPAFGCRALAGALVVPALQLPMRGTGQGSKSISTGISNVSEMDFDLRLQRTVHEVLCVQLDIRETNTVTKPPARLAAKPGLQQDRPLCSTVSRTAIPCIHSDTWRLDRG